MISPDNSASDARELLSCPFCGGSDLVLDENSYKTKWVICDGCGAQIDDSPHGDCVDLWNTRASPAPQGGAREAACPSPAATVDVADAFSAADEADWKRLDDLLGHSAYGKFWRNVFVSVRFALTDKRPPSMQEDGK